MIHAVKKVAGLITKASAMSETSKETLNKYQRIEAVVRLIPEGCVLTYGDVAKLAGLPRNARLVGHALGAVKDRDQVPWWRVINSQGGISTARLSPEGNYIQQELLEAEGVEFNLNHKTSLRKYRWDSGIPIEEFAEFYGLGY